LALTLPDRRILRCTAGLYSRHRRHGLFSRSVAGHVVDERPARGRISECAARANAHQVQRRTAKLFRTGWRTQQQRLYASRGPPASWLPRAVQASSPPRFLLVRMPTGPIGLTVVSIS